VTIIFSVIAIYFYVLLQFFRKTLQLETIYRANRFVYYGILPKLISI